MSPDDRLGAERATRLPPAAPLSCFDMKPGTGRCCSSMSTGHSSRSASTATPLTATSIAVSRQRWHGRWRPTRCCIGSTPGAGAGWRPEDVDDDQPGFVHWKTRGLVGWAAGRCFVWIDDEITDADRRWVDAHHTAPALLHHVDPHRGLTRDDIDTISRWRFTTDQPEETRRHHAPCPPVR